MRCCFAAKGYSVIARHHREEQAAVDVAALHARLQATFFKAAQDMIMHLWSRTAVADKEGLTSKIGPYDTGLPSKPVV